LDPIARGREPSPLPDTVLVFFPVSPAATLNIASSSKTNLRETHETRMETGRDLRKQIVSDDSKLVDIPTRGSSAAAIVERVGIAARVAAI
jgi:phage baseplate assembly protein W